MSATDAERVLRLVQRQFGEIGKLSFEDDCAFFDVYRGPYEDAPQEIDDDGITIDLVEKFDDPFFAVAYRLIRISK